jgi:D-aspartate ligase
VSDSRYSVPALVLKIGGYPIHHGGLGIIRSLGTLGVPVYTVIEHRFAPAAASRYLKGKFIWDTRGVKRAQLLEGLENIGKRLNRPTVLIPTDDIAATLVAEEAAVLERWFLFPKLRENIPRTLANKRLLHELCKEIGVPQPRAIIPQSINDVHSLMKELAFPVVVKATLSWPRPRGTASVQIVHSPETLLAIYRRDADQISNFLIQEYIPGGVDWFFHGYCNARSECLAAFTGRKLRSHPPYAGPTVLGQSVVNDSLRSQTEALLKAINYVGILDIDYRFDGRDGRYKILDFNPRVGAQFRLFEDCNGIDVVRAMYYDLTGQPVCRSRQIDGRIFVVEPQDLLSSLHGLRKGELTFRDWWMSFKGTREFAWFRWNDPGPFLIVSVLMIIKGVLKAVRRIGVT